MAVKTETECQCITRMQKSQMKHVHRYMTQLNFGTTLHIFEIQILCSNHPAHAKIKIKINPNMAWLRSRDPLYILWPSS